MTCSASPGPIRPVPQVEHFSRYGLLDDDEEEEAEAQDDAGRNHPGQGGAPRSGGAGPSAAGAVRKLPPGVRAFGLFDAQDDEGGLPMCSCAAAHRD